MMTSEDNRGPLENLYGLKFPNCDRRGLYNVKQVSAQQNFALISGTVKVTNPVFRSLFWPLQMRGHLLKIWDYVTFHSSSKSINLKWSLIYILVIYSSSLKHTKYERLHFGCNINQNQHPSKTFMKICLSWKQGN